MLYSVCLQPMTLCCTASPVSQLCHCIEWSKYTRTPAEMIRCLVWCCLISATDCIAQWLVDFCMSLLSVYMALVLQSPEKNNAHTDIVWI